MTDYVHGYSDRESQRLLDQGSTLARLLHDDTRYPAGSLVLEAGCGVGAQTVELASCSQEARFISVDISRDSLDEARRRCSAHGVTNVEFQRGDIFHLPFGGPTFDHVFVCFVLEHLPEPGEALQKLIEVLKPGGTLTVIEGDHGSVYFHPESPAARKAIQCLIDLQAETGGNSLIGRQLYPLLSQTGLTDVRVSPRMVYVDSSRPELVEGFTRNTFTAMVEGIQDQALKSDLIDEMTWIRGVADLYRTSESDGTFCYTFFKAVGIKSSSQ